MSKRGPKFTSIDWTTLDKLCGMQCTKTEIADFLEISEDTIERAIKREFKVNYAEYYEQKAAKGRISLRRKQYDVASSGNVTMLIWLGKQYLGQSDKLETDLTSKSGAPLVILTMPMNGSEAPKDEGSSGGT